MEKIIFKKKVIVSNTATQNLSPFHISAVLTSEDLEANATGTGTNHPSLPPNNATTSNRANLPYNSEEIHAIRTALKELSGSGAARNRARRVICLDLCGRLGRSENGVYRQIRQIERGEGLECVRLETTVEAEEEDGSVGGTTTSTSAEESEGESSVDGNHQHPTAVVVRQKRRAAQIDQQAPAAGRNKVGVNVASDPFEYSAGYGSTGSSTSTSGATQHCGKHYYTKDELKDYGRRL